MELLIVMLLVLWVMGFIGHVGGDLIHLLLVIALIVFIYRFVANHRGGPYI
jgi:hypothetical protein